MRVFYASDDTPNPSFQSNIWRNNLYLPLLDLGHDVVEFQYDLRSVFEHFDPGYPPHREFIDQTKPKTTEELLRQIKIAHKEKPIDLFFSYFFDVCVMPQAIDEIRAMGIKTVNWYCNGSYQLHMVAEIAPHYDWCLVPEKFRLSDYIAMGANPIYCQEAANPNVYKPYSLPVEFDVTFVGQAYGERPSYIEYLLNRGIDIRVWGSGWQAYSRRSQVSDSSAEHARQQSNSHYQLRRALHVGRRLLTLSGWQTLAQRLNNPPRHSVSEQNAEDKQSSTLFLPDKALGGVLPDLEMIQMYSRSKINLGFSTCGNTHQTENRILQIRLRDFEVPMSGGFYMVEYIEELEEFFNIGKEIVCYTNSEDLADKIQYYLAHDTEREAIRTAGYERCRRDHTWHKRFEKAFQEMGLSSACLTA